MAAIPARIARAWSIAGILLGVAVALVRFAPASWATDAVATATDGRVMLADAQGTVWDGSALPVLSAGGDSRESLALPSRLEWTIRPGIAGLNLTLVHACCLPQPMQWTVVPGWNQVRMALVAEGSSTAMAQWPAGWLAGLGTPWNTLQPGGLIQFSSPGMSLHRVQGRWQLDGQAQIDFMNASSRISTLDRLGSYRIDLSGRAQPGEAIALTISTLEGVLQISGTGQGTPTGLRFRGEAHAAPGQEAPLNNLLNIIGRRSGAISVISIG